MTVSLGTSLSSEGICLFVDGLKTECCVFIMFCGAFVCLFICLCYYYCFVVVVIIIIIIHAG